VHSIVYKKLETLKAEGRNDLGGPYGGLGVNVAKGEVMKNENGSKNTPICLVDIQPDSPIVIPAIDQIKSC
jgi:hypothetical protein